MPLIRSEMDYVEEKLRSGFVLDNPNEDGCCGCGESFHVNTDQAAQVPGEEGQLVAKHDL